MSTAAIIDASTAGDQRVEMRDVDWRDYSALLRARGNRSVPKLVYLDGSVSLMSPSFPHERLAERLGLFVMVIVEEPDIPCVPAGSTTFRRRKKQAGVEGDKTFYLANEERIRGKTRIDPRVDPPPDLAVEAVHTHGADDAVEVWRRLGVPEVWVCDAAELTILVRDPDGRFHVGASRAFPFLTADEIHARVAEDQAGSETAWIKNPRSWTRRVVVPRVRGGAEPESDRESS